MQTSKMTTGLRLAAALLLTLHFSLRSSFAQSEGGLLMELAADKKVNRQLTVGVEADMRTRNNFRTMDRWSVGVSAGYKLNKWVKFQAGYTLLDNNMREKMSYQTIGGVKAYNNWLPSYWGIKHRVNASVTATYKFSNNIRLSLRERWQFTYRPEKTVQRWDFDNATWEEKVHTGSRKHQLRSRLQVEYDKKRALLTPYASIELYNQLAIEKIRYTVGTDINVTKQHTLGVFYRFQNMKNVDEDDYDPDMHYLGISYKFKF